jgi:predicted nucleotidyltransferase
MTQVKLGPVLITLRRELLRIFGHQLEGVYLYGSHARGDARPDSDVDVLIVLRNDFDYGDAIKLTSQLVSELSLENEIVISRVFVTKDSFEHVQIPFLMNVRREAVQV